jgi:hypothetical protein
MHAANIFLVIGMAAALLPGVASAQYKQVDSIGFGKTSAPARTVPGGLKASGAATKAPRVATYAPLTVEECKGLGGRAQFNFQCRSAIACTTVDQHGVVRTACVNK